MTLLEARTLVASWVDDLNLGYFTQAQVDVFLNNAQYEVQKLLLQAGNNRYIHCVQTSTVVNQSDYVLPQDFHTLHRLEMIQSGTFPNEDKFMVEPITLNQLDGVANRTGTAGQYFLKQNKIVLVPCPDAILSMRMYYSYRVAKLTLDTDVFDIPDEYAEFAPVLATIDCLLKDGRDATTALTKKVYYENMLKVDAQERQQDRPRSIVMNGGGFDSGYGGGIY